MTEPIHDSVNPVAEWIRNRGIEVKAYEGTTVTIQIDWLQASAQLVQTIIGWARSAAAAIDKDQFTTDLAILRTQITRCSTELAIFTKLAEYNRTLQFSGVPKPVPARVICALLTATLLLSASDLAP